MKFLVDAQLPRRLTRALAKAGHDAVHTLNLPDRNRAKDGRINQVADAEERVVVSKDTDFRDSHLLRGTPHQLLEVTTGNIRNAELLTLLDTHLPAIEAAFEHADRVEFANQLVIHARRDT
ncbi:MAG: DUF5615 family PIN-like protein [Nocardioides sp.]|uniref:DUF5615 family PIN-like protein n=1 Tax=Nocardioides sp. TaxID=35761 RepID=UPI0039E7196C